MNEYLDFEARPSPSQKTAIVDVISRQHGDKLGEIRWHGRWRQYAFFPATDTIWNPDCLDTINAKIRWLMRERQRVKNEMQEIQRLFRENRIRENNLLLR